MSTSSIHGPRYSEIPTCVPSETCITLFALPAVDDRPLVVEIVAADEADRRGRKPSIVTVFVRAEQARFLAAELLRVVEDAS